MTIDRFKWILKYENFIPIGDDGWIIFNDFEVYNERTLESKEYDSLNEALEDNPNLKKIIEETEEFYKEYSGGRGSSSSGEMGGGFTSAGGGGGGDAGKARFPAELNTGTAKGNSVQSAVDRFADKYANSDHEYGALIDENGYAHHLTEGGATSVAIPRTGNKGSKNMTTIHNHPSGGAYSKQDLSSFASSTNEHRMVVVGKTANGKSQYNIEKTSHFDAKGFKKGIDKAKWPTHMSYSQGADWWLKKNAKKYGYKYSATGVPKE